MLSRSTDRDLCAREIRFGIFLEHRDDTALAVAQPLRDELRRECRLAASRRAGEQHDVAGRNAAAGHLVEAGNAGRETPVPIARRARRCCSGMRGNTCMPAPVIRNVCSPGIGLRPRTLTARNLRVAELRSTSSDNQRIVSATVNTGCRCSSSAYSPIRNDVTSHVVSCCARRLTKRASSTAVVRIYAERCVRQRSCETNRRRRMPVSRCADFGDDALAARRRDRRSPPRPRG